VLSTLPLSEASTHACAEVTEDLNKLTLNKNNNDNDDGKGDGAAGSSSAAAGNQA
jgi:hypothetical protein